MTVAIQSVAYVPWLPTRWQQRRKSAPASAVMLDSQANRGTNG
jgi:hypothetical protein